MSPASGDVVWTEERSDEGRRHPPARGARRRSRRRIHSL